MTPLKETPTRIAVAVVEQDGEYLIGQRPAGVTLAGLWEFPGGKVESNETENAAAERECLEETGLAVVAERELSKVTQQYAHGLVEVSFIACRPTQAPTKESAALRPSFRWVARDELTRYEFPAANADLVAQLARAKDF